MVKSDWFMFVDSDVILSRNWFAEAEKLVKDDVGAVWGIEIWSVLKGMKILRLFERVTLKIFEKRGGTHDLLVRRKTVEDIKIPFHLHTYEDGYIKDWIEKKGIRFLESMNRIASIFDQRQCGQSKNTSNSWSVILSMLFTAPCFYFHMAFTLP